MSTDNQNISPRQLAELYRQGLGARGYVAEPGYVIGVVKNRLVTYDGEPLDPTDSQKIINHSPDGFNWGYVGSGPAQLALAVLLEMTGPTIARLFYQAFKAEVIGRHSTFSNFRLSLSEIEDWIGLRLQRIPDIPRERTCRVCGCTNRRACAGGCSWVRREWDLCSRCAESANQNRGGGDTTFTPTGSPLSPLIHPNGAEHDRER